MRERPIRPPVISVVLVSPVALDISNSHADVVRTIVAVHSSFELPRVSLRMQFSFGRHRSMLMLYMQKTRASSRMCWVSM